MQIGLGNRVLNFRTIWRALIGWDTFSSIALPLWPSTKIWLCHPLRLFIAVSMIPRIRLLGGYCGRHLLMTEFGVFTVNPPVEHLCNVSGSNSWYLREGLRVCARIWVKRSTRNYLVLVWSSCSGEFQVKARNTVQDLRISRPNFVHVFLGLFRDASFFFCFYLRHSVPTSGGICARTPGSR